jgi:hypothetical protein
MDLQEKRQQVADQCRVVAHMANVIASVHSDYARLFQDGAGMEGLEDQVGERTAVLMNTLGDILNGIDAVDEADAWVNPVMARSREVFPEKECPACDRPIPHDEHVTVMGKRYHIPCQPPFPK